MKNSNFRGGAALVEFAFVMPVLLLTTFMVIEFSRSLLIQHTADTAAYEGARSAMVPGATASDAIAAANQLLGAAQIDGGVITVSPEVIEEDTAIISVEVRIPLARNSWIIPEWIITSDLTSEVTLFCERSPVVKLTGIPALKVKKQQQKGPKPSL